MKTKNKLKKYNKFISYLFHYFANYKIRRFAGDCPQIIIIASAHKVGSTWLFNLLRDLYIYRSVLYLPRHLRSNANIYSLLSLDAPRCKPFLDKRTDKIIVKTHSMPPSWIPGDNIQMITMVRDPRDIVISNINYLSNIPVTKGGWPELSNKNIDQKIKLYLEKGVFDLDLLENWYDYPSAINIHYEDLIKNTSAVFQNLLTDIHLSTLDRSVITSVIEKNSFKQVSGGRKEGQENSESFYRKGIAGDWKNYFNESVKEAFKTAHNGRWNHNLVKLGYEQSPDW